LKKRLPRLSGEVARFAALFASVFALTGGAGVCPLCGSPSCAGAAAGAGFWSALISLLTLAPRWLRRKSSAAPASSDHHHHHESDHDRMEAGAFPPTGPNARETSPGSDK